MGQQIDFNLLESLMNRGWLGTPAANPGAVPLAQVEALLDLSNPEARSGEELAGGLSVLEALFISPMQVAAESRACLRRIVEFISVRVPRERRIPAPASLALPVLERLKFLEDDNPLQHFYMNLLAGAVDQELQEDVHPAFVNIVGQLSVDEAVLLIRLKRQSIDMTRRNGSFGIEKNASVAAFFLPNVAPDVDLQDVPPGLVKHPKHLKMYFTHLVSLNLIKIKPPPKVDTQIEWLTWTICPSDFGKLFIAVCVPELPAKITE